MSLGNALNVEGITVAQTVDGETFQCLTIEAKPIFIGIINPDPGIDPRLEFGSDVRERSTVEVLQDDYPDGIAQETKIQQISLPDQPIWRIVKRELNPSDPCVHLWVVRVVPGIDQQ